MHVIMLVTGAIRTARPGLAKVRALSVLMIER